MVCVLLLVLWFVHLCTFDRNPQSEVFPLLGHFGNYIKLYKTRLLSALWEQSGRPINHLHA